MKRKVLYLKAPLDIKSLNKAITPSKLYSAEEVYSNIFGTYFWLKNNHGNNFCLWQEDLEKQGWKPIYNTDVYIGYATAIIATILFVGLILFLLT